MTLIGRVRQYMPDHAGERFMGGAAGCPSMEMYRRILGKVEEPDYCKKADEPNNEICSRCWKRRWSK